VLNKNMTNDEVALDRVWVKNRSRYICGLYHKYADDLLRVRAEQKKFYQRVMASAQFDDVEAEFLYLSMRAMKPQTVVEVGSGVCWSTSWLLQGLRDNAAGQLIAYDITDHTERLPEALRERLVFTCGDVREQEIPEHIDFLLSDSNHNEPFASELMATTFPRVRPGGRICVHDVFQIATPAHGEAIAVFRYLDKLGVKCYTPAKCFPKTWDKIQAVRAEIGITEPIHFWDSNPLLIFDVPNSPSHAERL